MTDLRILLYLTLLVVGLALICSAAAARRPATSVVLQRLQDWLVQAACHRSAPRSSSSSASSLACSSVPC